MTIGVLGTLLLLVVTLLGRNGAGKTRTLKSIMGIVGRRKGSARFEGKETVGLASDRIARMGVAICPEERGIFASLSAEENLTLLPRVGTGGMSDEAIYAMFPNLLERRKSQGTRLSGGCTSGHGVCGTSRLSPRSIAATATFMAVAGVVVFVVRHRVAP